MNIIKCIFLSIIVSIIISSCISPQSPEYDYPVIKISDVLKGKDLAYFRAVLMENGFKREQSGELYDSWYIPFIKGSDTTHLIHVHISFWENEGKKISEQIVFSIRHDLIPNYDKEFYSQIVSFFPKKEAKEIKNTEFSSWSRLEDGEVYLYLRYTKDKAPAIVDVELERDPLIHVYIFALLPQ